MHKGFWVSDRVVDFIKESQFYFIHRVVGLKFNVDFITALVERWRPETHSIPLTVDEATVTLQDVQVLLELRIREDVVTGTTTYNWRALIYELLGQTPGEEDLKGASLRIGWLTENFSGLPEEANEEGKQHQVKRHRRPSYCIAIVGMGADYNCSTYSHEPRKPTPSLRTISIRVARQFGWKQNIPDLVDTEPKLHRTDKRGAYTRNWADHHSPYIAMWGMRTQFRFLGVEDNNDMGYNDPYMVWYQDRTRRFISPTFQQAYQAPLGATAYLAYGFAEVHRTCNTEIQAMPQEVPPHYRNLMSNIWDHSSQSLEHVGYSHLLQQFDQPTQESQVGEQRKEGEDGSTWQELMEDENVTLQEFRRCSRRTNTSISPINEQEIPEPSKGKGFWSRLRGKRRLEAVVILFRKCNRYFSK
ncbi:hypothetical protein KSS87_019490 [Heliosperma pusillum]|nr:hypothetical protein KSS87_019490 [Heliosperma pusillum]